MGVGEQQKCRPPAYPRSVISTFAIRYLRGIVLVDKLDPRKSSMLKLGAVAEQADLSFTCEETLKTGFLSTWPNYILNT